MKRLRKKPKLLRLWNLCTHIIPYQHAAEGKGALGIIDTGHDDVWVYPDDARKLAKWLLQYADWHDKVTGE